MLKILTNHVRRVAQGVGGEEAGRGIGGEEVPVAIRGYFESIASLLRNHPTVLPNTMLGLMKIDNNEAIVVRTTMASQQFGISPDIILRKIAYSHGRFGKGERKFRFKVQGGGYQQANCLGVYLCCLPATLKQELKTLLEVPAQLPAPVAQDPLQPVPAQLPPPDVEHVAQNPEASPPPQDLEEGMGLSPDARAPAEEREMRPALRGLATSTIRGPHASLAPPTSPHRPPVYRVPAGPRLAPVEVAMPPTQPQLKEHVVKL
ncbi:hypothetical protein EMCRGX_G029769 [Ephydatia muelleri]